MTIFQLKNPVQHYDWGSSSDMSRLFGIENASGDPMAELWMGAHPIASSKAVFDKKLISLDQLINNKPEYLGRRSLDKFGKKLPFLFKVLSAAKPLSIQTHPNKQQAEEGFRKESEGGITLDAFDRNYRDDNHKPELVYALTPFKAMNGFRQVKEILNLFGMANLGVLKESRIMPHESGVKFDLKRFYETLMRLSEDKKARLIKEVLLSAENSDHPAWQEVKQLHTHFPDDIGILSPLLLNVITLSPGQAMFLDAGTLHAYMKGTALEIMACSDNVLRGGLTSKHVDIDELLRTLRFTTISKDQLLLEPETRINGEQIFSVAVDDFLFSILQVEEVLEALTVDVAEILFCVEGRQVIRMDNKSMLELTPGESCFISAENRSYQLLGKGVMARARSR